MEEENREGTIHDRLLLLKHAAWPEVESGRLSDRPFLRLSYDSVLDALDAIYKECNGSTTLSKDKYISRFLKKYKSAINEFDHVRLKVTDFNTKAIIGQGHFGEVRVVEEKSTNEVFAMKVMKKNHILQQADAAFFIEERDIMALSSSHWLTRLHYAFQDDECLYLVMDYHPGGDLFTIMGRKERGMNEEEACFYLAEITCALQDLHNLGYVHRDVKPDNVLIARSGHIKLVDFGSASRLDENGKVMDFALPVGTPEYISPEVLTSLNQATVYGVSCDWWSLGIILYELLFEVTPFEGSSTAETYGNIMNFETSLQFPDDVVISSAACNLIQSLLVGSSIRLTYNDIIKHPFFSKIDWKNIQSMVPPFIPMVTGSTDTSNFDTFEPVDDLKDSLASHKSSRVFTGKNLPFVGFTYTSWTPYEVSETSSVMPAGTLMLNDMASDIKGVLETYEEQLKQANQHKSLAEKECLVYKKQLQELHDKLAQERKERGSSDSKALQLLAEVREQSQVAQDMIKSEKREFSDQVQSAITQLEQERLLAIKKAQRAQDELKKKQIEFDTVVGKVSDLRNKLTQVRESAKKDTLNLQNKLNKANEDFVQRMTQMHNDYSELQEKYACAIKELRLLEDSNLKQKHQLKTVPNTFEPSQLQILEEQLQAQKQINEECNMKVLEYENELQIKTKKYQDLEKSFAFQQNLNTDLQEKYDTALKELKSLENADLDKCELPTTSNEVVQEELRQLNDEYNEKVANYEKEIALNVIQLSDTRKELEVEQILNARLYDENRSIRQEHGKLQAAHMKLSKQLQSQESRLMQVSKETEQALQDKATMEEELDLERTKMRIQAAQFTKLIDYHQNTPSVKKTKKIPASLKLSRKKRDPEKERDEWTKLKDIAKKSRLMKEGPDKNSSDNVHVLCISSTEDCLQDVQINVSSPGNDSTSSSLKNSKNYTPGASSIVSSKVDATPKSGIKRSSDAGTLEHNIPHRWIIKSVPFHKTYTCVACNGTVKHTQKFAKCSYCDFVCHQNCTKDTPNSCGLPQELAQQLYVTSPPKKPCLDKENTPSISSLDIIRPLSVDIARCSHSSICNTTDLSITSSMLAESTDNEDSLV